MQLKCSAVQLQASIKRLRCCVKLDGAANFANRTEHRRTHTPGLATAPVRGPQLVSHRPGQLSFFSSLMQLLLQQATSAPYPLRPRVLPSERALISFVSCLGHGKHWPLRTEAASNQLLATVLALAGIA